MKQRYSKILILFLLVLAGSNAFAQQLRGGYRFRNPWAIDVYLCLLPRKERYGYYHQYWRRIQSWSPQKRRNTGVLRCRYISKTVRVGSNNQTVNVKLAPDNVLLNEVIVKPQKEKYSRKNNPAVEFMKKVIEHKKAQVLEVNEYYQYDKYEKMKMPSTTSHRKNSKKVSTRNIHS